MEPRSARVAGERAGVGLDIFPDLCGGEGPEVTGPDVGFRRQEPAAGGDDEDAGAGRRGGGERRGISQLAPEIEAAEEAEQLPQRYAFPPQPAGEIKAGARTKDDLRPAPSAMGGGKEEDPAHVLNLTPYMPFYHDLESPFRLFPACFGRSIPEAALG
jgi:hypothetical protein